MKMEQKIREIDDDSIQNTLYSVGRKLVIFLFSGGEWPFLNQLGK
jgi:hypothetical protein